MSKIPVIIDCDPGLDDVVALLVAFMNEKLDVKAVTVVAGNQTLEKVGENAEKVLSLAKANIPLAYGFNKPIVRELVTASEVHGEDGLFGVKLPDSNIQKEKVHAIDLMAQVLKESEEKVTLVPIGPLTNIAIFLTRFPELKDKIERICLMGGAINGGNCTASAEFNIFVDPEAADIVFKSGVSITMCGLDVTHKAVVFKEDIENIKSVGNKVGNIIGEMLESLSNYHIDDGIKGCFLHDPVAVLAVANPDLITTVPMKVDIELKGEHTTGATIGNFSKRFNKEPNVDVAINIDRELFIEEIIEAIKKY